MAPPAGRAGAILGACLVAAILFVGCGEDAIPPELPEATLSPNLVFACGDLLVPEAALSAPAGAETADTPAAAAFRRFLNRSDPRLDDVPSSGFRVLSADDAQVVFATTASDGTGLKIITVRHDQSVWTVAGIGVCQPVLVHRGLNSASWRLPDGAPVPPPDAVSFVAMVTETECTSGRSSDGQVVPPVIVREPTRVLVVFAVRRPPVAPGDAVACHASPPWKVDVQLGGVPLGNRELLDGGVFPPSEVWSPACCG